MSKHSSKTFYVILIIAIILFSYFAPTMALLLNNMLTRRNEVDSNNKSLITFFPPVDVQPTCPPLALPAISNAMIAEDIYAALEDNPTCYDTVTSENEATQEWVESIQTLRKEDPLFEKGYGALRYLNPALKILLVKQEEAQHKHLNGLFSSGNIYLINATSKDSHHGSEENKQFVKHEHVHAMDYLYTKTFINSNKKYPLLYSLPASPSCRPEKKQCDAYHHKFRANKLLIEKMLATSESLDENLYCMTQRYATQCKNALKSAKNRIANFEKLLSATALNKKQNTHLKHYTKVIKDFYQPIASILDGKTAKVLFEDLQSANELEVIGQNIYKTKEPVTFEATTPNGKTVNCNIQRILKKSDGSFLVYYYPVANPKNEIVRLFLSNWYDYCNKIDAKFLDNPRIATMEKYTYAVQQAPEITKVFFPEFFAIHKKIVNALYEKAMETLQERNEMETTKRATF